jgi:hypothetical protein
VRAEQRELPIGKSMPLSERGDLDALSFLDSDL